MIQQITPVNQSSTQSHIVLQFIVKHVFISMEPVAYVTSKQFNFTFIALVFIDCYSHRHCNFVQVLSFCCMSLKERKQKVASSA